MCQLSLALGLGQLQRFQAPGCFRKLPALSIQLFILHRFITLKFQKLLTDLRTAHLHLLQHRLIALVLRMDRSSLIHAIHHSGSGILDLLLHEHQLFIQRHQLSLCSLLTALAGAFCLSNACVICLILSDLPLLFFQGMRNGLNAGADVLRVHLLGIDLFF